MVENMVFAKWLKKKRSLKGWRQEDLARESKQKQSNISRLESDGSDFANAKLETILAIGAALGASQEETMIAAGRWPYVQLSPDEIVDLIAAYRSIPTSRRQEFRERVVWPISDMLRGRSDVTLEMNAERQEVHVTEVDPDATVRRSIYQSNLPTASNAASTHKPDQGESILQPSELSGETSD